LQQVAARLLDEVDQEEGQVHEFADRVRHEDDHSGEDSDQDEDPAIILFSSDKRFHKLDAT
jgi:hypothetical protein